MIVVRDQYQAGPPAIALVGAIDGALQPTPLPTSGGPNNAVVGDYPLAVAFDDDGAAAAAYLVTSDDGYTITAGIWEVGSGGSETDLFDSQGTQNDTSDIDVGWDGATWVVAAYLLTPTEGDDTWLATWDGGTGTPAAVVPHDGGAGPAFSLDLDAAPGRTSLALQINTAAGDSGCGSPKLAETTDFVSFDLCNLPGSSPSFAGDYVDVDRDGQGRRTLSFLASDFPGTPNGLIAWQEP